MSIGGFNKIGFGKIKKESWKAEFLKVIKFLNIDGYDISYFNDKNFLKLDAIPQAELINKIEFQGKDNIQKPIWVIAINYSPKCQMPRLIVKDQGIYQIHQIFITPR